MLYTTKEIAEMYSSPQNKITPYMITQTWIKNGLKYIRGKGKGYLFKQEWVEEYIEGQAISRTTLVEQHSRYKKRNSLKKGNVLLVH